MEQFPSIALWTHPRAISTAFERYFLERRDFRVFHEEFAALYMANQSRANLPHAVLNQAGPRSYVEIRDMMERARLTGPVFHKDMCYHAVNRLIEDPEYLAGQTHVFLVRDPDEAVLSHATVHPDVDFDTLGYAEMPLLFDHCRKATGRMPLVIESGELIRDASATLQKVCTYAGIPFDPEALRWDATMPDQWKTWEAWHAAAAQSTGIETPKRKYSVSFETHPRLAAMADYCRPFYAHMRGFASPNTQEFAA